MNAVGIDVSKGKSTVTVLQPFGVVIAEPFEVLHTADELKKLVTFIKSLSGETKVVMEYTGAYYEPIANALYEAGIFVSVVNPIIINDYSTNRVRKVKTDKGDALRIAAFTLDRWLELREYEPADTVRKTLKVMNRQCLNLNRILVMQKNNLSLHGRQFALRGQGAHPLDPFRWSLLTPFMIIVCFDQIFGNGMFYCSF